MDKKVTMLMILDGYGINEREEGNAVKLANTPTIDRLMKQNPTTTISASRTCCWITRPDKWEIQKLDIQILEQEELYIKS